MIAAFRDSLGIPVGSVRAGNVIGGGDGHGRAAGARPDPRGADRRADRDPGAGRRRPWQHVLNPLEGYLLLAERLAGDAAFAIAFNFGPDEEPRTVGLDRRAGAGGVAGRARRPHRRAPAQHEAAIPSIDSAAPTRAWAGARHGISRPRSSTRSSGSSPAARGATSRSSRSSATAR